MTLVGTPGEVRRGAGGPQVSPEPSDSLQGYAGGAVTGQQGSAGHKGAVVVQGSRGYQGTVQGSRVVQGGRAVQCTL